MDCYKKKRAGLIHTGRRCCAGEADYCVSSVRSVGHYGVLVVVGVGAAGGVQLIDLTAINLAVYSTVGDLAKSRGRLSECTVE